jgi:hypothetical protein
MSHVRERYTFVILVGKNEGLEVGGADVVADSILKCCARLKRDAVARTVGATACLDSSLAGLPINQ